MNDCQDVYCNCALNFQLNSMYFVPGITRLSEGALGDCDRSNELSCLLFRDPFEQCFEFTECRM